MSTERSRRSANRRLVLKFTAATASAFLIAACGSSDNADDNGGGGTNADSPTTLRITTLGLCNEIPVFWADEHGMFDDNGLDVELVTATGGAAALTALQSGDIELAFTNPFSTMIAMSQGIELQWIATAYETGTEEGKGTNAIAVRADSGFSDAESLNGQTIGVNEIGGINEIITTEWMTMNGGDPSTVQFVALPFNELASAVASGTVGASQVPAQNVNPDLGLESLGDPYVSVGDGDPLVFAGYVTTSDNADSMADALEAFQASLIAADDELNSPENSDAKFELEAERCKQDVEYLKTLNENVYEARVDTAALERMGEILQDQGRVEDPASPEDFVPSFVETK